MDSNLNYLIASRSNVTNRVVYLSSSSFSTSSSKVSHVLGEIWGEISRENLKSFENFFFFPMLNSFRDNQHDRKVVQVNAWSVRSRANYLTSRRKRKQFDRSSIYHAARLSAVKRFFVDLTVVISATRAQRRSPVPHANMISSGA